MILNTHFSENRNNRNKDKNNNDDNKINDYRYMQLLMKSPNEINMKLTHNYHINMKLI